MTEMEQEKRASLHADVMLRRALDLRTKDNVLIAEFMDLRNTGMSIYEESDYKYHKSWDWLMPVVKKIESYNVNVNINGLYSVFNKNVAKTDRFTYNPVLAFI